MLQPIDQLQDGEGNPLTTQFNADYYRLAPTVRLLPISSHHVEDVDDNENCQHDQIEDPHKNCSFQTAEPEMEWDENNIDHADVSDNFVENSKHF